MLVDHHCHIDGAQFAEDRPAVVARACAAGVGLLVNISTRIARLDDSLAAIAPFPNVFCSVGTHPHEAHTELDVPVSEIVRLAAHPRVVAIGEAGLDYFYEHSTPAAQERGFRKQIEAARETGLPLVIHTRDADDDTARILEDEMARGRFTAVLHCFTGGADLARRALDLDLYVSFSGVVTFKKSDALRTIARSVPLDRILVETDAPYLAPEPHRGRRNEPAYVAHTARRLAEDRSMSLDAFAEATTRNALRLYSKLPADAAIVQGATP
jgi:TatD DNase family protein